MSDRHQSARDLRGARVTTTLRGTVSTQPEMPTGRDRAPAAAADRAARGRQRRADERHPDARQPRARSCWSPAWAGPTGGAQLHRRGHVPLRHARLHHRPDRPAAEAARAAGDRLAHRVPALPRQRPQGRPRGRRPAAPRADLAPPRRRRPARRWPRSGRGSGSTARADPGFLHVRYGAVRPAARPRAGAAGERRRSTRSTRRPPRRCTGCSSCTGSSPTCRRRSTCGPSTGSRCAAPRSAARSLARAMICSATAFQSPDHLVVAVLSSEQNLAHWDWVKWLPHAQSARADRRRRPDADGLDLARPTWRRCCRPTSATGRGSAPTSARRRRTCCSSSTAATCRPATTSYRPTACTA